jgi:hypothetical protein
MIAAASALLLLAAPSASPPYLTPDGWGPVRIGMSRAEVEAAMGTKLQGQPIEDEYSCIDLAPVGEDRGIYFMFEAYKLSRITIAEPSRISTPRGIGIGASADDVRRAYGRGLQAEAHLYLELPAEYLTYWVTPDRRGVRFETDDKRNVQLIHAGGTSIQYVEGCV